MQKLPPEEYYRNLPKKRMAAGVLFFNTKKEILLVKTNYRLDWSIPGGVVDENESPRAAAIREVKEEINLDISHADLLCVDYTAALGKKTESLQFVFFGGILTDTQISKIRIEESELDSYNFFPESTAIAVLHQGIKERMPYCLQALAEKRVFYIES